MELKTRITFQVSFDLPVAHDDINALNEMRDFKKYLKAGGYTNLVVWLEGYEEK